MRRLFTLRSCPKVTVGQIATTIVHGRHPRIHFQAAAVGLVAGVLAGSAIAQQDRVPTGIPHLDHVFLIMMENHGYQQVTNNPNEPYLNSSGTGTDAATPAVDTWNEVAGSFVALADLDGVKSVAAAPTKGETIADQLDNAGMGLKSYQESLPLGSINGVDYSNGTATNLSDFTKLAPLTSSNVVQLYAVKHNPFAYFASIQDGNDRDNSLANTVGFDGPRGLYSDLASGNVPAFSFIVPNQCDDQHGRSNSDAFCAFDYGTNNSGYTYGTQVGLNPGLIQQGDRTIERLVKAIHDSRVWQEGRSAIVIVWDENDYSGSTKLLTRLYPSQNQNRVVLTVQTNYQNHAGVQSGTYYTSFSVLKTL
jgi:hypothetical protein